MTQHFHDVGADVYKENILDHYRNPRNRGAISPCDIRHREVNASCGDDLEIFAVLEGDKLVRMAFEGRGCAVSQAAVSILTEHVAGMRLDAIMGLGKDGMVALLGIPVGPSRLKCALLGLKTLQNGLEVYRKEHQL